MRFFAIFKQTELKNTFVDSLKIHYCHFQENYLKTKRDDFQSEIEHSFNNKTELPIFARQKSDKKKEKKYKQI